MLSFLGMELPKVTVDKDYNINKPETKVVKKILEHIQGKQQTKTRSEMIKLLIKTVPANGACVVLILIVVDMRRTARNSWRVPGVRNPSCVSPCIAPSKRIFR